MYLLAESLALTRGTKRAKFLSRFNSYIFCANFPFTPWQKTKIDFKYSEYLYTISANPYHISPGKYAIPLGRKLNLVRYLRQMTATAKG